MLQAERMSPHPVESAYSYYPREHSYGYFNYTVPHGFSGTGQDQLG